MASGTILTENNIHNWVGEAQYNRGLRYVREGLVLPYYQAGRLIKGWCLPRDGQTEAYSVWARTAGIRICDAHCSCPLGKYGICPHVAAVLVHYVRDPHLYQRSIWERLFGWRTQSEKHETTPQQQAA